MSTQALGSLVLAVLLAGCGGSEVEVASPGGHAGSTPGTAETSTVPSDCETFSVSSYPLLDDPESAVAFGGNPLIFEAQIDTVDPAIKVLQPGMAVPFLVYLPVHLTVTAAYKGGVSAGQSVVLRDLGGTAADCTTFTMDDSYPDAAWQPGLRLFVFANDVTSPEGRAALTPNWVFAEREGLAVSMRGGTETISVSEMRSGVRQRQ